MENTTIEIWKDIKGYEGLYQVSNLGNIKSCHREGFHKNGRKFIFRENKIKKTMSNSGYLRTSLVKDSKTKHRFVHREVAKSFLPNIDGKNIVDHIDGNKTNNKLENLRWCNQKENIGFFFK